MDKQHIVQVGQEVRRIPETIYTGKTATAIKGTVVYVHPENRFHIVAFPVESGATLCETFQGVSFE